MTGRRSGCTRRLFAGRAIAAAALGLAGVVGAAPPTSALEPIRIALGDGLRHVEIGVADTLTVSDPAAGRVLFSVPGPRILRVIPAGAGLDVVGARRVDLTRIRLETRRGPLRIVTRDYIGVLEIWRQPEGGSRDRPPREEAASAPASPSGHRRESSARISVRTTLTRIDVVSGK